LPLEKLHGDEGLALVLANLVNRADVGMVQGRRSTRFALESLQRLAVFGQFLGEEL
jgi:hypothetical protein